MNSTSLDVVRDFIEHGAPVFACRPRTDGVAPFYIPQDWQRTESRTHVPRGWRRKALDGWGFAAVCGIVFDVIDVDKQHDGDTSYCELRASNSLPPSLGLTFTPSGGFHRFIACTGFKRSKPWQGIDLQSGDANGNGRGFIFIPPTVRVSKTTGELTPYESVSLPNWDALAKGLDTSDPRTSRFLGLLEANETGRQSQRVYEQRTGPLSPGEKRELVLELEHMCLALRLEEEGFRNDLLFRYAYAVGGWIAGSGLDEYYATEKLRDAALASGLSDDEVDYHLGRNIEAGMQSPTRFQVKM